MCAASRMCVDPEFKAHSTIPLELTKFAWSVVIPLGVRIDVSKARLKAIPYYMKMGYFFVRDSIFKFERWDARCGLIAYPANPQHKSKLTEVFQGIGNPCELSESSSGNKFTTSFREFTTLTKSNSGEEA